MASLSVRKIDEDVYDRLRLQAARQGVSMEEYVRRLLRQAVSAPQRLAELALSHFGPDHGIELDIPQRSPHDPPELDE